MLYYLVFYLDCETSFLAVAECIACPAGYYCSMTGLSHPTGLCQAGYFCQAGSHLFNGEICPPNYYCPAGSSMPIRCPRGTFSDAVGKFWWMICEN